MKYNHKVKNPIIIVSQAKNLYHFVMSARKIKIAGIAIRMMIPNTKLLI